MLSKRAQKFLDSYPREENVCTLAEVEAAFLDKGVPFTDALRDFHQHMAGCIDQWYDERIVYGLVHRTEEPESLKLDAWPWNIMTENQTWLISRALGSPLRIDPEGVLYDDFGDPCAESWQMALERAAFLQEYSSTPSSRSVSLRMYNSSSQLEALELRVADFFQKDISDRFVRAYASETWVLYISDYPDLTVSGPLTGELFKDVVLQLPDSISSLEMAALQIVQQHCPWGCRLRKTDTLLREFLRRNGPITDSMEYALCNSGSEDLEVERLYQAFQYLVHRGLLIGHGNWPMLAGPRYTECGLSAEGQKLLEAIAAGQ